MSWYYVINGRRQGPATREEIDRLATEGVVTDATFVSQDGATEWRPYSVLRGADAGPGVATEICAVSGKPYPRNQMMQFEGRWISAEHRDEFFQRLREGVARPPGADSVVPGRFGYARFRHRAGAAIIDAVLQWVVGALIGAVYWTLANRLYSLEYGGVWGRFMIDWAVGLTINFAYETFFVRRWDATPGRMALGLKLLRCDGSRLSIGRILARELARIPSGLLLFGGYLIVFFSPERRALHDYMCDTCVIRVR